MRLLKIKILISDFGVLKDSSFGRKCGRLCYEKISVLFFSFSSFFINNFLFVCVCGKPKIKVFNSVNKWQEDVNKRYGYNRMQSE